MNDKRKNRPIDRKRDAAFSITINDEDDASPLTDFVNIADRMLTITKNRVYEVLLADQIDPDRTNPDVPHSNTCLIHYGSDSDLVSRTLLMGDLLIQHGHLVSHIERDRVMSLVLSLTTNLAHAKEKSEEYLAQVSKAIDALPSASKNVRNKNVFTLPEMRNVDTLCKEFFLQSKHVLQDLLNIANEFFPGELKKGFFSNLYDLVQKKHGKNDILCLYLEETKAFRELIRISRNCFEHPKPKERVIIRNIRMNKSAEIELPTFELIHPAHPQEEVLINDLLPSLCFALLDFSENLLAHLVEKNMQKTFAGSDLSLLWHPEGYGNSNIRYSYGIVHNGEIKPLG